MEVSRNGAAVGKLQFELYHNHAPNLAENFIAFCNGSATRSLVGTKFNGGGMRGLGVTGGVLEGDMENLGAFESRLADESLELRHHKRGLLTMVSDGPHANGS